MILFLAGVTALAAVAVHAAYRHDMRRIAERVAAGSELAGTRHGAVEYAAWGSGQAVLVVHGAGGGYDQGKLIPATFGGEGYRWVSVSRFGYLRSPLPADASTRAQAEAFADLLDALGIERASVVAMSGGVPPSLKFAELFPERTQALVLLSSAPFTPFTAAEQDLAIPAWAYQLMFSSDFVFWAVSKLSPGSFDRFFDVGPEARSTASEADLAFIDGLVDAFLPVTERVPGLENEGAAIDPAASYALPRIEAPTLIAHARDDGINPFAIGEHLARHIRGAEFHAIESGGHLLLGHIPEVQARVRAFLGRHAGAPH